MKKVIDFGSEAIAIAPLIAMVVYCLYQLLVVNIDGNGKVAIVIALMLSWGLLFARIFVELVKRKGNITTDVKCKKN